MKNRYSKEDRTALYITALLILCFLGSKWIDNISSPRPSDVISLSPNALSASLEDSPIPEQIEQTKNYSNEAARLKNQKSYFLFNPNSTSKDSLLMLPIDKKVIHNLIKYREKGGQFKSMKDLTKIYGMEKYKKLVSGFVRFDHPVNKNVPGKHDESQNKRIIEQENNQLPPLLQEEIILPISEKASPSINLEEAKKDNNPSDAESSKNKPLVKDPKTDKTVVEINNADQYQLMLVDGIGAFYSKLIIDYRDRIGGFYSKDQLLKIKGIPADRAMAWLDQITINESKIKKKNVNDASFKQLSVLPGIGYKKAEILKLYLQNNGKMESINHLLEVGIFHEQDLEVLSHYLTFD